MEASLPPSADPQTTQTDTLDAFRDEHHAACISDRKEICPRFKAAYDQGCEEEKDAHIGTHDQQQKPPFEALFSERPSPPIKVLMIVPFLHQSISGPHQKRPKGISAFSRSGISTTRSIEGYPLPASAPKRLGQNRTNAARYMILAVNFWTSAHNSPSFSAQATS